MLSNLLTKPAAERQGLLAPDEERLLQDYRLRLVCPLDVRERIGELVAASSFLAVAFALLFLADSDRSPSPLLLLLLGLAYAAASRVEFEVGPCHTVPTQLVLVPLLFVAPLAVVPFIAVLATVLGDLPDYLARRRHPQRIAFSFGDCWPVLGPVLVFVAAGEPSVTEIGAPLLIAALGAQFLLDFAASTPREWFEAGVRPAAQVPALAWTFAGDAALSCVGLMAALAAGVHEFATLLTVPLIAILAGLARERQARLDAALELSDAYRGTTMVLSDIVEAADEYTGLHSRTVVTLSLRVADRLRLAAASRRNVEFGALLHDIGKIAVPKEIINKPGPLTPEEWELVKVHTVTGQRLLEQVGGVMGEVGRVVRSSHERWDGKGYPDGLAGEDIPIESRVVCACDAFNAMTTDRSYRPAMSVAAAVAELRLNSGTQFDPCVVDALVDEAGDVLDVLQELAA